MSRPREIVPKRFYMITRRCARREFLMRPDPATVNNFLYCLGEAACRFGVVVVAAILMSNHHHTVVYDPDGRVIEFMHRFHLLFARAQNALRGRSENFWSSDPPSLVELVDHEAVFDAIEYTVTNPVKDGLVERVHHWPGSFGMLANGCVLEAHRPSVFFRKNGKMPERVVLKPELPPELGDPDDVRQMLRERVAAAEERFSAARRASGARVQGRRTALAQSWRSAPTTPAPRGGLRPRFAAGDQASLRRALERHRAFQDGYRRARMAMLRGDPVEFPAGTYWLHRFANVPIAEPAPS